MENGIGTDSNAPPGRIDKSRVLEVKPLRCLRPVFPNAPGGSSITTPHPSPFVCAPPSGPFPPGVQPFYPFLVTKDSQQGGQNQWGNFGFGGNIPAPVPLNSFKTPSSHANGRAGRQKKDSKPREAAGIDDGVEDGSNSGKRSSLSRKMKDDDADVEGLVNSILTTFKLTELDDFRRSNSDSETAKAILLVFDLLRRKLTQLEEAKSASSGVAKRPDLKTCNLMMKKGIRTNTVKRTGHVPGIDIGDIFFFRMEMCVVGVHAPSMAGIDYMSVKLTMDEEPLAVSIVSAGGYEDNGDDCDVLIYSGQGGVQRRDGQMFDQKLVRGNLALEKSLHRANDVRVIRGIKDMTPGSVSKIYVYDGLYKIQESWIEKNKAGCNVFKYKLVRIPGQPEAFSIWKFIQQWKDGTATRPGIIVPDLTSGGESLPVVLVNDVDNDKGPSHFTYLPHLTYTQPISTSEPSVGCHCLGGCQPGDIHCPCNHYNDGTPSYSTIGVLLSDKPLIHECGKTCACPSTCRNRVSQVSIKFRLEVFKTKNRGWGLRSWDPIRAGSFICEYSGDIIRAEGNFLNDDDEYIFDSTRYYQPIEPVHDSTSSQKSPFPLVISAKYNGNVARFMNHSCSPNLYWLPVLRQSNNDVFLHIAFFAIRHIPPMQELTFDYGIVTAEKGRRARKKCLCGSPKCRGYFH